MAFYNISDREGQVTISVFFDDGDTRVVAKTSPAFQPLLDFVLANGSDDEAAIRRLVDPAVFIGSEMTEIAGDRITYDLRNLFFDGKPMNNTLAQHIKAMIEQGDQNWKGLVRFMLNLDNNPSRNAQNATYAWVEKHGLTITEDGRFLGYKAVLEDHTSSHTGPDNYVNGVYFGEPGTSYHVPHNVGDVISKKRADVDDNPGGGCSVGLHVGTYDYAKDFAPVLMTVAVNPEHVVSADERSHNIKIRVCQYEVVALNKDKVDFIGKSTSTDLGSTPAFTEVPDGNEADVETPWKVVEFDNLGTTVLESFTTREAAEEAEEGYVERDPEGDYEVQHHDPVTGLVSDPDDVEDDEPETVREIPTLEPEDVPVDDDEPAEDIGSGSWDRKGDDEEEEDWTPEDEQPTPSSSLTLGENAALVPDLKRDLHDAKIGHKPLAAKWSHLTTESSVRRYRKTNGVTLSLMTKIKG